MTTRRIVTKRELDRNQWAGPTTVILEYETKGAGSFLTEELNFGVRFSGPPYMTFGAVLGELELLVEGDYPFVTAGVAEWVLKGAPEPDETLVQTSGPAGEYVGAKVWVSVFSNTPYKIRHVLKFEGLAMKTPVVER